ncbi:DUF998 domain-containing protein [Luteimonas yindakuii]|nr:DUF998 domain-containing protein [Luteimonas yindakuii]
MSPSPDRRSAPSRIALLLAAAGMALFVGIAIGIHPLRPDLHSLDAQMSRYLLQPYGGWLQLAYCALAIAIVTIAFAVQAALAPSARSGGPTLLFVAGAASLVVTAFAPMDADGAVPTFVGWVHGVSAQAAFLCVTVAMLVQSAWLRHDVRWRTRMPLALAIAMAAFAGLWTLVLVDGLPRGAAQKAVIAVIVLWLLVIWSGLLAHRREHRRLPGRTP